MKKVRGIVLSGIYLTILLMIGCTLAKISGSGTKPMMLNNPPYATTTIEHFKVSKMIAFDYTSSIEVSQMTSDVMQRTQADEIVNLQVKVGSDPGTFFVNLLTLGMANAKTVTIEGDAIKKK